MRIRFKYKYYPLSEKLTAKSLRLGKLTHPLFGFVFGCMIACAVLFAYAFLVPFSDTGMMITMCAMVLILIVVPILLVAYREKKSAQYDAEYEQLLQSLQSKARRDD